MGNAIVIKGADFSAESIGRVTFIKNVWIRNIGNKIATVFDDLAAETAVSALPYYFYGPTSPTVFAGKTISRIVAGFVSGITTRIVVVGVCDKNVASVSDFNNSYVEIGRYTLTSKVPLNITPFTVPEGKTIVYHLYNQTDALLDVTSDSTESGVTYGIPGLDRYVSNQIKTNASASQFIDFLFEEEE